MNGKLQKKMYPAAMVWPAVLLFTVFYMVSVLGSFYYSFTNWNSRYTGYSFVGLENFQTLLSDERFLHALANNFIYAFLATFLIVLLGLGFSLLLNVPLRGRNLFRAVLYFPSILTTLVIGYLFKFILTPKTGLLSSMFSTFGMDKLADTQWLGLDLALFSVIGVGLWIWTGYNATIFLAGLQTVPTELKEAARIDGAGPFSIFYRVILPFLRPSFTILVSLNLIGGMKLFDLTIAMTNGGPIYATETLSSFLFKAQATGALGYSTAVGTVQFLIITIVCLPILLILKRTEDMS